MSFTVGANHMKDQLKIALLIEQTSNHTRGIARGISLYAQTHGPWIFSTIEQKQGGKPVAPPLESFKRFNGGGIIAYTPNETLLRKLIDFGVPIVNTTRTAIPNPELPSVFTDDKALGRLVADYFIAKGFKEFAFCGSVLFSFPSLERGRGFTERIKAKKFNVSAYPDLEETPRQVIWEREHDKIVQWIQSMKRPLALFADNDSCGRILADICLEMGVHVPEDIAIIGANNDELICEFSNPHLSSVILAKEQVGFEAASLLERIIRTKKRPAQPVLVPPVGINTRRSSDIFAVENPHVAAALNFIYNHAGELISVTDILKKVALCRRHLELCFRQALGRSPYEEIRRAHVERAKKLLAETDLSLERIAQASGFSEPKHFYINFRKETGHSPTQYRKRYKITGSLNTADSAIKDVS